MLRPLDEIEPYRLEMGSKLKTDYGKNLYDYWSEKIALSINELSEKTNSKVVVNCASQEYFQAVDMSALKTRVVPLLFSWKKEMKEIR